MQKLIRLLALAAMSAAVRLSRYWMMNVVLPLPSLPTAPSRINSIEVTGAALSCNPSVTATTLRNVAPVTVTFHWPATPLRTTLKP